MRGWQNAVQSLLEVSPLALRRRSHILIWDDSRVWKKEKNADEKWSVRYGFLQVMV
jgi:hypothetical protein